MLNKNKQMIGTKKPWIDTKNEIPAEYINEKNILIPDKIPKKFKNWRNLTNTAVYIYQFDKESDFHIMGDLSYTKDRYYPPNTHYEKNVLYADRRSLTIIRLFHC